ncbi:transglutaminaseTgpA domain-containing protein [Paenibacillus sp. YYML68]|uniref:transglutaminase TgpA family protein n=1 Tax=Paenibacillus sp. YYML68 TaxID=2909250 RepID=UPI00248F65D4|nr:transglutaminaseTgpA domain-containing protein [Paenibacillus sp. YYML68]
MSARLAAFRQQLLFHEWPHRLTVLLCGLYVLQFVLWFEKEEHWWLPETVMVVQLTLLAICIIEHIPWLHWLVRGALELVSIVVIQVVVLRSYGLIEAMPLRSFVSSKLFLNLYELTPYLWFSLGAWVVYLTLIWWVESKWRIYMLLVLSVLGLSIRDSFSNVYLWREVAVVVGCGLVLLILAHFRRLKRKDPDAWRQLADYPFSIVLPVAAMVGGTILVGVSMPEIGPMVTDPYTAWRTYKGESTSFTTGKGVQVNASPDALDSSSGYSRNDRNLGSGFQFDYTPVMTVDTTHRSYWRGEALAQYTGRGWQENELDRSGWSSVRPDTALPFDLRFPGDQTKTLEVTQTVELLTETTYPVLFGAYSIQKLTAVNGGRNGFEAVQWSTLHSELRYNERVAYPKTYTVVSQIPIIDEEALRKAPKLQTRPELTPYLQLPDQLPQRVRTLAADITKNATNEYDKAKLIEQYLTQTFPYTNKPDLTKGRSRDFVDRFLFEIKEGYCDYYSSAMAVMARSVGLPTRWVKGYTAGASQLDEQMFGFVPEEFLDANEGGQYTVRNSDAHSWVEVYFSGYGWVPFEPTSGFVMPTAEPVEELELDVSELETDPAAVEAGTTAASSSNVYAIVAGLVTAALAVMYAMWRLQLVELIGERMRRRRASQMKQRLILECERLLRILRRSGYEREEHETLRESARRWTKQSRWMKPELETLLALFEKAKYGRADITEADWHETVQIVDKLREQLK